MKSASAALAAHLAGPVTTLATCWRVTRRDGAILGFTDHDRDLTVGGVTYWAALGYDRTAIRNSARFAVDNLDVEGVIDDDRLTEDDLRNGLYDLAEIVIFLVNWQDPGGGSILLRRGWVGEITVERHRYRAELRGLSQALSQRITETYAPECRADLGDGRCQVDLGSLTVAATVAEILTERRVFTVAEALGLPTDHFDGGVLTWTSGANIGIAAEVRAWNADTATVNLLLPMPREIAAGDTLQMRPGCDKRRSTCRDRFDNILNFRGEPFVPGENSLLRHGS